MRREIEHVRQTRLANFSQVILLDGQGRLVDSDNAIFNADEYRHIPASGWFPFLESVFPTLSVLEIDGPPLKFSKVEHPAPFLPGFYDFTFSKKKMEDGDYILWEIFDYTELYQDFQAYQQKRNELEIHRQHVSEDNQRIKSKEGIPKPKRQHHNTAFDKAKITTAHALDMLVAAISAFPPPQEVSRNALDSLDDISGLLDKILDELPEVETNLGEAQSGLERSFSVENILYDTIPYIASDHVNILEATISEDLPKVLHGNPLDFKRIIVALATNVCHFYRECTLVMQLYLHDQRGGKCIVGVRITAMDGVELNPDMMEVLMRLAVVQRILDLHQGKLDIDRTAKFHQKVSCRIPFWCAG